VEVPDVSGTINIMTFRFPGSAQFSLLVHEGCFLYPCAPQSEWKHGMFDPFKVRRRGTSVVLLLCLGLLTIR